MAFTSTLIVCANMLGVYISAYFINISDAIFHRACDIDSAVLGCALVWIIMAVLMLVAKGSLEKAKKK
ncbi:MAG: hypothetical protein IKE21_02285 [Erysipelotrichaceae bacterium]|nr:hypothetical protein [Erysipelotrichaceae bacterium]